VSETTREAARMLADQLEAGPIRRSVRREVSRYQRNQLIGNVIALTLMVGFAWWQRRKGEA
jgi:hypothetical protein